MNFFIPLGEFAAAIVPLTVLAIAGTMILLEKRRRRRRLAAGLPLFGPAVPQEGAEGTARARQSLALSCEVVEHFRATGPGWQARIDEVLKRHVRDEEERARGRGSAAGGAEGAKARVAEEKGAWRGEGEESG